MFKPSKFQEKIFNFIVNGIGNAVINAVAGSGKTTTLLQSLSLLPKNAKVLFLAFNKDIKDEIKEKVAKLGLKNVQVNTCHGFGMGIISNNFNKIPKIDNQKYRKLLRALVNYGIDDNTLNDYKFKANMRGLISLFTSMDWDAMDDKNTYQNRVLKLADLGRMFMSTDVKSLTEIANKFSISNINGEVKLASALVELGNNSLATIDFADMIYLPNKMNLRSQKYEVVFIDECQDLNTAQRNLFQKGLGVNSRFIAVGDKNQAIYGFAGADADSFDKLTNIQNTTTLPLSVCYRCGSDIVDLAKSIVPQIEAFKGSKKGQIDTNASVNDIVDGDMVLCRNTYPLVKLCLAFLKQGKKAKIKGSDISKNIVNMIKNTNAKTMSKVFDKLYHKLNLTEKRIMRSNKVSSADAKETAEYTNMLEKIQVIEALNTDVKTVAEMIDKLKSLFSDDNQKIGIQLSSVHRSKGLEADNVYIIHSELMPSQYATQDWEITQEENLRYVAYTRAKKVLGFVTDFDAYSNRSSECQVNNVSEVKDSKYIGNVGDKIELIGNITEVKYIATYDCTLYVIQDANGNIFEKWGVIPTRCIGSDDKELKVGTIIRAKVVISKKYEFRGIKKHKIKNFAKL